MTDLIAKDPKEIVAEHLETLGSYAARVLINGGQLMDEEMPDKTVRLQELQAVCASYNVTQKVCLSDLPRAWRCRTVSV